MRSATFPEKLSDQTSKAIELVRALIMKVLNREEEFTLNLRKSNQRRFDKVTHEVIVPPLEVNLD